MTSTTAPTAPATTLNAADRCDRCGAQAFVRVVLASGDLLFCGHHGKSYEQGLRASALEWVDETSTLTS